jgi:hypothetical protein
MNKSSQSKCFFAALWPLPCKISPNLGCCLFTLLSLAHAPRFSKKPLCPAITHKATIVLPDFTRSCSTDGGRENKSFVPVSSHQASLRGTKQSLRIKVGTASYEAFLFALYSLEIASYLAMTI